jgi:hypothetical protein
MMLHCIIGDILRLCLVRSSSVWRPFFAISKPSEPIGANIQGRLGNDGEEKGAGKADEGTTFSS